MTELAQRRSENLHDAIHAHLATLLHRSFRVDASGHILDEELRLVAAELHQVASRFVDAFPQLQAVQQDDNGSVVVWVGGLDGTPLDELIEREEILAIRPPPGPPWTWPSVEKDES